jgi:uncharacterized protein YjbJ (UPF0337 family)
MNKDQLEGKATELAGKAQQKWGEVTGDPADKLKGAAKEMKGKAQQVKGDIKDAAEKAKKEG